MSFERSTVPGKEKTTKEEQNITEDDPRVEMIQEQSEEVQKDEGEEEKQGGAAQDLEQTDYEITFMTSRPTQSLQADDAIPFIYSQTQQDATNLSVIEQIMSTPRIDTNNEDSDDSSEEYNALGIRKEVKTIEQGYETSSDEDEERHETIKREINIDDATQCAIEDAGKDVKDMIKYMNKIDKIISEQATIYIGHDSDFDTVLKFLMEIYQEQERKENDMKLKLLKSKTYTKRITYRTEDWTTRTMITTDLRRKQDIYSKKYVQVMIDNHYRKKKYYLPMKENKLIEDLIQLAKLIHEENYNEYCEQIKVKVHMIVKLAEKISANKLPEIVSFCVGCVMVTEKDLLLNKDILIASVSNHRVKAAVAEMLAKMSISRTKTERPLHKNIVRMTASGEVKVSEDRIVLYNSQGEPSKTVNLSAQQITNIRFNIKPDDFVQKILQVTNIIIIDVDNVIKAMHVTKDELIALLKYLSSWGVTTIQVTTGSTKPIEEIGLCVNIDEGEHDDIAMMVISRVHKALIMTSDNHSEFKDLYTYCSKHKTIQVRINEECEESDKGECRLHILQRRAVGKIIVKNIVVKDGIIKSLMSTDKVVEFLKVNVKTIKTRYKLTNNLDNNIISTKYWVLPDILLSGPIPAASHKLSSMRSSLTVMRASLVTTAMTAICTHRAIALITVLEEIGTTGVNEIKEVVETELVLENGYLVIKDIEQNKMLCKTDEITPDANIYTNKIITIMSKIHKASVSITGSYSVQNINKMTRINEGNIDIKNANIYITGKLIEENIVVIENRDRLFVVKLSKEVANMITTNAISALKNRVSKIGDVVYLLPLTTEVKKAITMQYESADKQEKDELSADYSIVKGKWNPGLSRYFMEIDADKPSRQLMADPENTTFVLSTIGLDVQAAEEGHNIIEFSGQSPILEYHPSSKAMLIYTAWENMQIEERVIDISTVHWAVAGIKSMNCSTREIEDIRLGLHEITEVIIRDTTKDILNIFNSINQGYTNMLLPPLVRSTDCISLKLKKKGNPIKLQIQWALPTCSVISRLIIYEDYKKTLLSMLVSVSPPITHNYIATMLTNEVKIENEYNVAMCEYVEEETFSLFEYIQDKMQYMSLYFAAYGIYSLGMKLMGLDPIKIILKSESMIEYGAGLDSLMRITHDVPSVITNATIEEFISSLYSNVKPKTLRLRIRNYRWQKYIDTHKCIDIIKILADTNDYQKTCIAWTVACVIIGKTQMLEHMIKCCNMKVVSQDEDFKRIFEMYIKPVNRKNMLGAKYNKEY